MSFPIAYPQPESLAIPSQLVGDELKSFKGAKNAVKAIPTSSGSTVGPSSTIQFSIPTGGNAFIKPNSMYFRCKILITNTWAADGNWSFAGNDSVDTLYGTVKAFGVGGGSSLINKVNVNFGSTVMSYNNYNHFRNAVLPHSLNSNYFQTDLRQLEHSGVVRTITAASQADEGKTAYLSIPLWIPVFNSSQAFPSLLMKNAITLELLTETVASALTSAGFTAGATYALSEMFLVYEEIQVSPEFKSALLASKAGQNFNMSINDWWSMGPTNVDQTMRYQIGCSLSSLKAVLFTEQAAPSSTLAKKYITNGLLNYNIYVDNAPVSPPNITDDAFCFGEMNRALQKINDSNCCSYLEPIISTNNSSIRNTYTNYNFLAGASTMVISDYGYSSCGIPASTVTIELTHGSAGNVNINQWQNTTAYATSISLFPFLLHDSIVSIDVSQGIVSVRK